MIHVPGMSKEPQEKAATVDRRCHHACSWTPWKNKAGAFSQLLGYDFYSAAIRFLPFIILLHERPKEGDKSVKMKPIFAAACITHGQK